MTADPIAARHRLAPAPTQLLAALVTGEPPPPGFDPARLRAQADALLAKRRAVVARLRPDLVEAAGGQFRTRFDTYARTHPRPAAGAPADATAFAAAAAATAEPHPPTPPSTGRRRRTIFTIHLPTRRPRSQPRPTGKDVDQEKGRPA